MAFGRAHLLGAGWGAWLGGSGGNVHLERTTFPATTGELGAWYRRGGQRVTLSAVTVNTSTVSTLIYSDQAVVRVQDPVHYADISLIGHGSWRRLDVDAIALTRQAWKGELESVPAASVAAAWWMMPNVAIAAAIGRQLADPIRGTVRALGGAAWSGSPAAQAADGLARVGVADRHADGQGRDGGARVRARRAARGAHERSHRLGGEGPRSTERPVGDSPNDSAGIASRQSADRWRRLDRASEPSPNRR